ncbi:MAG: protein translocase subunit SecD [Candidatus Dormibacteria bacterium]|jgi:SecD/SecF fusion protein
MRITKWKVAAIFIVVLVAVVIDGWSYVARVTSTRTSQVVSSSQDTTTSFAVTPGTGGAFAAGQSVTVGGNQAVIKSVKGDVITLESALPSAPAAKTEVSQNPGLAGLTHQLTSPPTILGAQVYVHKGLDIQGGSELTIAICIHYNDPPGINCRNGPENGVSVSTAQSLTIPVLQQRVNGLGVSEATVQGEGDDLIIVQLPGVALAQAESTIGTTAQLHFATAVAGAPPAAAATNPNYCGENPGDSFCKDQDNLFDPSQLSSSAACSGGPCYLTDSTTGEQYHWKIDNKLPASDISSSTVGSAQTTGAPVVDLTFNSSGGNEWNAITNTAYSAYESDTAAPPPTAYIAIFLDNKIISVPYVSGGDQGNHSQISGLSLSEAQTLNSQISAGALPAEIETVAATAVSPTLGVQTVNATLLAGAIGMIIVILFMIGYYRFPGLLASAALILYSLINLAAYKLIGVTVSLAGLAGFVLSVGMAVDANVLIFERTRDELRHGRPVGIAVETGFRRAFPAIRDSNISTEIVCFILYFFGFDVVKGFALTLGIGVAISFFSAVLITQSMLAWVLRWKIGRNPTLYTEIHGEYAEHPPKGRFDIVKRRNLFFAASLAIIIPGLIAMLFWHDSTSPEGFRLGIDFAGGDQIQATFVRPTTTADLISDVNSVKPGLQPQVQNNGKNSFSIQTLPTSVDTLDAIYNKVNADYDVQTSSVNQVGPSIASSLVVSAIVLILISAILIAMYLAYQFGKQRQVNRWRFAACTFFKLLHDVFVLAGIWAIIGHFTPLGQVDSYFITALLTAVAFSIHDTIVVFDRIRENLRVGPRFTFDQTVNLSTVQTMTRSLNTSLTVVFVLLALVLFGGSTIQGFVLALLVGIVTGTYSSIFNASTLLVAWDKARPQQLPGRGGRRVAARPARAT